MIVRAAGGVTLIGGGVVTGDDLACARALAPLLVAADGGADAALALGAVPDAVIGDLDSLSDAARARIGAARIHAVAEQDSTDFAKALARIEAGFIIAIGFDGRRLDHTLAALSVLAGDRRPVIMLAARDVVFRCPPRLALDLAPGTRLSLFPMGACRGRSTGLAWPIDGLALAPDGRVGTSNRATGPVRLAMTGPMLVMVPREALAAVMRGVIGGEG